MCNMRTALAAWRQSRGQRRAPAYIGPRRASLGRPPAEIRGLLPGGVVRAGDPSSDICPSPTGNPLGNSTRRISFCQLPLWKMAVLRQGSDVSFNVPCLRVWNHSRQSVRRPTAPMGTEPGECCDPSHPLHTPAYLDVLLRTTIFVFTISVLKIPESRFRTKKTSESCSRPLGTTYEL